MCDHQSDSWNRGECYNPPYIIPAPGPSHDFSKNNPSGNVKNYIKKTIFQVIDNVCYRSLGHSYFLEDGGEKYNMFDGNIAIGTMAGSLIPTDV